MTEQSERQAAMECAHALVRAAEVLDVQADMVADLTPEQRERYDATLKAWRTGGELAAGLAACEVHQVVYSASLWCADCSIEAKQDRQAD